MLDPLALVNQLNKLNLDNWDTKLAALPGQFQSALEDAILLLAPKSKTYSLSRKTISSQAEVDAYVSKLKSDLESLLDGSISIILK